MNAIIEFTNQFFNKLLGNQAEQDGVHSFNGGVHPPQHKTESSETPIAALAMPAKLTLPLRQHIGNLPKLRVSVGDHVLKGQLLAEPEGNVSAAIHAPTSGKIVEISEQVIAHPSGLKDHCITLRPDGKDEWGKKEPVDWRNLDKHLLVNHLRESGIVGLGGATFPSHIKLRTDGSSNIQTLVINAAECEPYITCDDRLMREQAEAIAKGIEIVKWMLGAEQCIVGIEDNKPDAETAMHAFADQYGYEVKRVPTLYPSGDARRLIRLLTGQEVPHNKRSTEIGVQVFNVATVLAIHRYFDFGEPAISRIVTMTGAVKSPQNFEVLIGTPLSELVAAAGGAHHDTTHFVMGGPMMGFNLPLEDVPIAKASNCIIAVTPELFEAPPPEMPCIRCARCADACPVSLQPQELYWFSKSDQFEKARDYKLFDCIECGCCSYVCPSNIPLVQYYRYAKSEVITADKAKEAADLARERNEFRIARIEREKVERAKKHAERAQAAKAKKEADAKKQSEQATPAEDADKAMKQEAIAAAVARAKAKKEADAQAGLTPKNTENVSPTVAAEIEAIDAARNQAQARFETIEDTEKQAKIQAAIEKAKAVKANKQTQPDTSTSDDTDKQAKIQAAIAKAKAAKEAAGNTVNQTSADGNATDAKQAKIAAAIAKAKANKASADQTKHSGNTTVDDDKQAKIQAAIAKAKAAKEAATSNQPKPTMQQAEASSTQASEPADDLEADKQARIQAALARARANKQAADAAKGIAPSPTVNDVPASTASQSANTEPSNTSGEGQSDKVKAALARARANKQAADAAKGIPPQTTAAEAPNLQPNTEKIEHQPSTTSGDGQSDKVKAALARARANKQAADKAKGVSPQSATPAETAEAITPQANTQAQQATEDDKQAKINAALERARANKRKADAAKQQADDDA